ncbi:MAG TPA: hypothetical protein VFW15_14975, partial [Thermoanaerobaculia bacterium]|nr:hypothetical protein [Thermoanaerobaculia bacterium]
MTLRVLVVASSPEAAEAFLGELRRAGYDVESEVVGTRDSMYRALHRQSWDVVLSDPSTADFGSLAALDLLRQLQFDVPFLVVSDGMDVETAVGLVKAG